MYGARLASRKSDAVTLEQDAMQTLQFELQRKDKTRLTLPTLRVVAGPDMLRFCTIYPNEEIVIGRDEVCELVLHHASVSRRHARIESAIDGRLVLHDLGSTNGTSCNGARVTEPTVVQVGDIVEVGGVMLRIDRLGMEELAHLTRVVERLQLANHDPLTGLVTRRWLDDELPALMVRHVGAAVPLSAVFIDVDRFKSINDTYGHAVGDEVLRAVSRLLVLSVRDGDTSVRYGGEELLTVLPNCDEASAAMTAERVRAAIAEHDWSRYAEGLAVTVSAGVAAARPGETGRDWLERADRALYAAKHGGRNRVVRAGGA